MSIPKPLERDIQSACLDYLRFVIGAYVWRQNAGAVAGEYKGKRRFIRFSSERGVSDIIGVVPGGRMLAVECKRPGGKATLEQEAFLACVRRAGGIGICVDSVEALRAALAAEGIG